jgi:hypothetical protein
MSRSMDVHGISQQGLRYFILHDMLLTQGQGGYVPSPGVPICGMSYYSKTRDIDVSSLVLGPLFLGQAITSPGTLTLLLCLINP